MMEVLVYPVLSVVIFIVSYRIAYDYFNGADGDDE
jgi:hypothetical protein